MGGLAHDEQPEPQTALRTDAPAQLPPDEIEMYTLFGAYSVLHSLVTSLLYAAPEARNFHIDRITETLNELPTPEMFRDDNALTDGSAH